MIGSSVLRLLAAGIFVFLVSLAWTTPSEAHSAHGATASPTFAPVAASAGNAEVQATAAVVVDTQDCSEHGSSGDAGPCCSNACHAVMSEDLMVLGDLTMTISAAASLPEPTALAGPTAHIKRPPRSPAATVG